MQLFNKINKIESGSQLQTFKKNIFSDSVMCIVRWSLSSIDRFRGLYTGGSWSIIGRFEGVWTGWSIWRVRAGT